MHLDQQRQKSMSGASTTNPRSSVSCEEELDTMLFNVFGKSYLMIAETLPSRGNDYSPPIWASVRERGVAAPPSTTLEVPYL